MTPLLARLPHLSTAEDFFRLLDLPYAEAVLDVSRLHILKRFQQYIAREDLHALSEDEQFGRLRAALARAYDDFVQSTPLAERLFKVLRAADGRQHVGMDRLRATLPSQRAAA
jgi:nitrogenase-stabilizing/protective protein